MYMYSVHTILDKVGNLHVVEPRLSIFLKRANQGYSLPFSTVQFSVENVRGTLTGETKLQVL